MPKRLAAVLFMAVMAGLAGCGTEPSRFYTLTSAPAGPPTGTTGVGVPDRLIGLEPIELPDYLRRPEIVLRGAGSRLVVLEFDRWGGSLDAMMTRALIRDLGAELHGYDVVQLPLRRDLPISHTVEVEIERFDAEQGGPAVLEARWRIHMAGRGAGRAERPIRFGRTAIRERVAGSGEPGDVADALSQAVRQLARDIAASLVTAPGSAS